MSYFFFPNARESKVGEKLNKVNYSYVRYNFMNFVILINLKFNNFCLFIEYINKNILFE